MDGQENIQKQEEDLLEQELLKELQDGGTQENSDNKSSQEQLKAQSSSRKRKRWKPEDDNAEQITFLNWKDRYMQQDESDSLEIKQSTIQEMREYYLQMCIAKRNKHFTVQDPLQIQAMRKSQNRQFQQEQLLDKLNERLTSNDRISPLYYNKLSPSSSISHKTTYNYQNQYYGRHGTQYYNQLSPQYYNKLSPQIQKAPYSPLSATSSIQLQEELNNSISRSMSPQYQSQVYVAGNLQQDNIYQNNQLNNIKVETKQAHQERGESDNLISKKRRVSLDDLQDLRKKNNVDIRSSINVNDVFVDPVTQESHLCGDYCTARQLDTVTDTMVCPISGRTFPLYVLEDMENEQEQPDEVNDLDFQGRLGRAFNNGYECSNEEEFQQVIGSPLLYQDNPAQIDSEDLDD